jgi:hypothetical protein
MLGHVCVLAVGLAMAMGSSPAAAKHVLKHKLAGKPPAHASKLPFGDMPKGPLEIFISINQQRLHFYSDGVHIADAPVATGVPGHLTPLGVFSVIERDRYHHSNLYSNAPMPFMQRITWSGVALHEGPGVGHQASHGCIRMPGDFAARLWMLPTMGMRVIIAHPELQPLPFADPHLFVHRDVQIPTAALPHAAETAQTAEPGTKTDIIDAPAVAPTGAAPMERASIDAAHRAAGGNPAAAPEQAKIGTALPAGGSPAKAAPTDDAGATKSAEPTLAQTVKGAAADAAGRVNAPTAATRTETAAATSAAANTAPQPPAPAEAAAKDGATMPAPQTTPPAADKAAANATAMPNAPPQPAATAPIPAEAANVTPAPADITAPITIEDVPLPLAKPAQIAKGGSGPIAIFISRKLGKIYVRQDFTPLFDAPVKIEHPEEPFGTHVFTALDYLSDQSTFRWSVVTLPAAASKTEEHWKYVRDALGRRVRVRVRGEEQAVAPQAPSETPPEVLARIEIPQDVIEQISRLIVPGSSLIVSDQGLGPETGSGTDFIVVMR